MTISNRANELLLYIENDGRLYQRTLVPIQKNLMRKKAAGIYDSTQAIKLFVNLVTEGAKLYAKEFGSKSDKWNTMFDMSDRKEVAKGLLDSFEEGMNGGDFDEYIPKKYQKKPKKTKKSARGKSKMEAINDYLGNMLSVLAEGKKGKKAGKNAAGETEYAYRLLSTPSGSLKRRNGKKTKTPINGKNSLKKGDWVVWRQGRNGPYPVAHK